MRSGASWGLGEGWNDAAPGNTFPDWLQIDFSGSKTIDEIDVFTVQDNWQNPVEPTEAMTFSLYGLTGFDVQYWNGSSWMTVPGGSVGGNNKVWKKITFAAITTSKVRVLTNASPDGYSRLTEVEAWGPAPPRTNVALASNGATATASSVYPSGSGYDPSAAMAINGDRTGRVNGNLVWWNDGTGGVWPDWLQVDFGDFKMIDEIDVFMIQDDYASPKEPSLDMLFTKYGLTNFRVQYWTKFGSWSDVPPGEPVINNMNVWKQFKFSSRRTNKIRVLVSKTPDGWSRIAELEAWGY